MSESYGTRGEGERQENERTHENTVMRLLSRSAHGWAVALIIDVVENLCRQETMLPAVPPHYDIISEGWPTAAVYPITRAAPWNVQRRARSQSGHAHLHMYTHTRASKEASK